MKANLRRTKRAVAALVGLTLATTALPAAMAARVPDLKVTRIAGVDRVEQRGVRFQARLTVGNTGRATATKTQAIAYLSTDSTKDRSDIKLGKAAVGRLIKHKSAVVTIRAAIPSDTDPGDYYFIACADATAAVREASERNNCLSQPVGVEPGPTTSELLDASVAGGEIDEETALLYEVFGAFGDSRFPKKYRGDDEFETDAHGLIEAALTFDSLSTETQEALIPFLQPPVYPDTWEDLPTAGETPARRHSSRQTGSPPYLPAIFGDEGWFFFEHDRARIWFEDSPIQRDAAQIVYENLDEIWTDLTKLMDRPPLSDAGPHVLETTDGRKVPWGDGGNGKLDIYMAGRGDFRYFSGAAVPYGSCCPRPSFIIMNPWYFKGIGSEIGLTHEKAVAGIAAHEFMHVLQLTHNRDIPGGEPRHPYFLMNEGVADWAINYVFPDNNLEHVHPYLFTFWYQFSRESLWDVGYSGWPFFLYLEKKLGSQIIRTIYRKSDELQGKEIWEAVDAALSGNMDERFFEFSQYLLNDIPAATSSAKIGWFEFWDGVLRHHDLFHEGNYHRIALDGGTQREFSLVDPMRKHSAQPILASLESRHVSYRFEDDDINKIVIENKNAGQSGAHLGAYLKLEDGEWQAVKDWSDQSTISLCRELPSENVTDMLLVFANSKTADPLDTIDLSQSKLKVSKEGCRHQWRGNITVEYTVNRTLTGSDYSEAEDTSYELSVQLALDRSVEDGRWLWHDAGSTYAVGVAKDEKIIDSLGCTSTERYEASGSGNYSSDDGTWDYSWLEFRFDPNDPPFDLPRLAASHHADYTSTIVYSGNPELCGNRTETYSDFTAVNVPSCPVGGVNLGMLYHFTGAAVRTGDSYNLDFACSDEDTVVQDDGVYAERTVQTVNVSGVLTRAPSS